MNENKYVNKIVEQYTDKDATTLEELKLLDRKVNFPPKLFAYIFGGISALILGFGMCVAMQVILSNFMWIGIIIGILGIILCIINYFIYRRYLKARKNKYKNKIIELSNEILNK
ncbi:MAG: dihydropteridine reductase [Anaeroplasma sp.]